MFLGSGENCLADQRCLAADLPAGFQMEAIFNQFRMQSLELLGEKGKRRAALWLCCKKEGGVFPGGLICRIFLMLWVPAVGETFP